MPQRKLKAVWTAEAEQDLQAMHLVGYKGSQFLETGVVYAPYIPLYTTPYLVESARVSRRFTERYARYIPTRNVMQI